MEEVSRLPISPSHRAKLIAAGYSTLASLADLSPSLLARDLNIAPHEAWSILKSASETATTQRAEASHSIFKGAQTAWDMLSEEQNLKHISTGCEDLDKILGGGIHCKEVTEVDTEGSFMVKRAYQIAEACIRDTLDSFVHPRKNIQGLQERMQPNNFLSNIFYFRICSYTEQIAVLNYLDKLLAEHKDVKIVIIDSVTFHFRQDFDDLALRTRVLGGTSLQLMKLAKRFSIAVVLLNQVTTKFTEGSFQLTLALGDTWSHACTNRIILYWNNNERHAYIDKSPSLRSASAAFCVTAKGIRNATNNTSNCSKRVRMM